MRAWPDSLYRLYGCGSSRFNENRQLQTRRCVPIKILNGDLMCRGHLEHVARATASAAATTIPATQDYSPVSITTTTATKLTSTTTTAGGWGGSTAIITIWADADIAMLLMASNGLQHKKRNDIPIVRSCKGRKLKLSPGRDHQLSRPVDHVARCSRRCAQGLGPRKSEPQAATSRNVPYFQQSQLPLTHITIRNLYKQKLQSKLLGSSWLYGDLYE